MTAGLAGMAPGAGACRYSDAFPGQGKGTAHTGHHEKTVDPDVRTILALEEGPDMLDPRILESRLFTYIRAGCCDFWTLNPYPRCDHNCSYCITQAQGASVPAFDKAQTLHLVGEALEHIPADLPIAIGGISDAYPNSERRFGLTRSILALLNAHNRAYSIITKGTVVERDMDLIAANAKAQVVFSFSSLDDAQARKYELDAPSPRARMALLKAMASQGIRTSVSLKPWMPGVTDVRAILDEVPAGVPVKIERLKIIRASRQFPIEGALYSQQDIDTLYLREQARFAGHDQLEWQLDATYSPGEVGEEHPLIAAERSRVKENARLLERGKLLLQPRSAIIYSAG